MHWFAVCIRWLSIQKGYKGIISRKKLHTSEISVLHHKLKLMTLMTQLQIFIMSGTMGICCSGRTGRHVLPLGRYHVTRFQCLKSVPQHLSPITRGPRYGNESEDAGRFRTQFPMKNAFCQDMITAYSESIRSYRMFEGISRLYSSGLRLEEFSEFT